MQPDERPPPFAPSSYEPRSPIPLPSPIYDDTRYPSTPPPSAPPEFENEDEFNDSPVIIKPSAPPNLVPSAPPESEFNDSPVIIKPSSAPPNLVPSAPPNLVPSAPPESEFDDVSPVVIKPSAPTPPVPIMELQALQALQALQPSAPPTDLTYFQDQLNLIEEETNNLKLALIESELEYILREISKLTENECDKQCQESIDKIQPDTLEEFLIKNMNDIFKEE